MNKDHNKLKLENVSKLISEGVTIIDPYSIEIRGELVCGKNVTIDINVVFKGKVFLGNNVIIGANSILEDAIIKNNSTIKPFSIIETSVIGENTFVGPYARIKSSTNIGNNVQIGNFVEIKNSLISENGRINHLSYIGDSMVESDVTIGAGTITTNHDGQMINQNIIRKDVSIGSASTLITPIEVGNGATIGAGCTIYRSVPPEKLTLSRSKQFSIKKWKRPKKKK